MTLLAANGQRWDSNPCSAYPRASNPKRRKAMCLSSLERKWWVSTFLASSKRGRPKPAVINNAAQGGLCKRSDTFVQSGFFIGSRKQLPDKRSVYPQRLNFHFSTKRIKLCTETRNALGVLFKTYRYRRATCDQQERPLVINRPTHEQLSLIHCSQQCIMMLLQASARPSVQDCTSASTVAISTMEDATTQRIGPLVELVRTPSSNLPCTLGCGQ